MRNNHVGTIPLWHCNKCDEYYKDCVAEHPIFPYKVRYRYIKRGIHFHYECEPFYVIEDPGSIRDPLCINCGNNVNFVFFTCEHQKIQTFMYHDSHEGNDFILKSCINCSKEVSTRIRITASMWEHIYEIIVREYGVK